MAFNGSGTYVLPGAALVDGQTISATEHNTLRNDMATALTTCVTRDGQSPATANIPMGNFKHTGLGSGTARTESVNLGQVQDGTLNWIAAGGTADVITATYSPALTELVDGQFCFVKASAANATTTPTFSPNGITARTIVQMGGLALVPGSIRGAGHNLIFRYDLGNTRWELLNPAAGSSSQVFSVSTATAAAHAPRASQLVNHKVLPVNGGCMVDQVNAGALTTPTTGSYPIDNVHFSTTQASKLQSQQITTSLLTLNASHALRFSVLSQYTPVATDNIRASWRVEGIDIANWQWGTANAKAVSLQFKARAAVAGTYSGALRNAAATRSYPFSFTLAANTDTLVKIENIAGDTTGTWESGEALALQILFDLGSGSNNLGTANAWAAAGYVGVTGSASLVSQTNGSTLDITDVYINEDPFCREFPRQRYADVLRDCQRYLPVLSVSGTELFSGGGNISSTSGGYVSLPLPVQALVAPTGMSTSAVGNFNLQVTGVANSAVTAMSIINASKYAVIISVTGTGNPYIVGNYAILRANSAAAKIIFGGAQI